MRVAARGAMAVTLIASTLATAADDAQASRVGSAESAFRAELVKPGLYRIDNGDGSTLLRVGSNGLIVIDSNREGSYDPLMKEVRDLAKGVPVGALVLTATGPGQIGNLAQFVSAGVPVIVQQRAHPAIAGVAHASAGAPTRPFTSYDTDYQLRVGNVEAEVEHVGKGRTGVDSVVYFPDLRALAVGELFTADTPEPDCASGGSFAGWAASIAHLLYFDFDVAIPSRGAPVGKRELQAFKAKLEALAERPSTSSSAASGCSQPR